MSKLVVAVDVDDVLYSLYPEVVDHINEKFGTNYEVKDIKPGMVNFSKQH